jgi:hypothetical protein
MDRGPAASLPPTRLSFKHLIVLALAKTTVFGPWLLRLDPFHARASYTISRHSFVGQVVIGRVPSLIALLGPLPPLARAHQKSIASFLLWWTGRGTEESPPPAKPRG